MQNTFVLAGPPDDPAGVRSASSLVEAMAAVAAAETGFVSRGDESGTHVRELSYWEEAGIDPAGQSWYQESGVGQGQSLLIANEREAYTVTDSATFLVLRDRLDLVAYVADAERPNVYSAMLTNPDRHREAASEGALSLMEFLVSYEARAIISEFGREEYGQPLHQPPPSD
jgi:tungstate transport system substrate-binding protein